MINVLIADKQVLTREGLMALLANNKDIQVTGNAGTDAELEQMMIALKPHVLIIDHHYSNHFNIDNIKSLTARFGFTRILILSNRQQREEILDFIEHNIKNYLFKECTPDEIIKAVYATARGEQFFCKNTVQTLFGDSEHLKKVPGISLLSPREIEIVHLVAEGLTNKEIAGKLFLSFHTVKTHRKNIIKKLGFTFKNATELISLTGSI